MRGRDTNPGMQRREPASSWKPRLFFRLAAAAIGVICLGLFWLNVVIRDPVGGIAFGLAALSFILASAVLRMRRLAVVGCVLLVVALIHNTATQGTSWTNTLPIGVAGLFVASMSILLGGRARSDADPEQLEPSEPRMPA